MSFSKRWGGTQINVPISGEFGVIYVDSTFLDIQNRPATVRMQNEPTLNIGRQSNAPISLAGYTCVNFAAPGQAILQAETLVTGQIYLFANSSGFGQVNMNLDDNALVGGLSTYVLLTGQFVELAFDGTNLS